MRRRRWRPREIGEPVDQRQRALLIGLDGKAEPFPAREARIAGERGDDVEREVEALGFLGVDGEADADRLRLLRQRRERRQQFARWRAPAAPPRSADAGPRA